MKHSSIKGIVVRYLWSAFLYHHKIRSDVVDPGRSLPLYWKIVLASQAYHNSVHTAYVYWYKPTILHSI